MAKRTWRYKLDRAIRVMEKNSEDENLPKAARDLFGEIAYWLTDYKKLKEIVKEYEEE